MVTKQKVGNAFGDGGIIVDTYDWKCLSDDLSDLPTEGVAANDLLLVLDSDQPRRYFNGSEWAVFGG